MNIKYITPEERTLYDPSGSISRRMRDWKLSTDDKPAHRPDIVSRLTPEQWFDEYSHLMSKLRFSPGYEAYLAYNKDSSKYWGRQGGNISYRRMLELVSKYYEVPKSITIHPRLYEARDYLIERIKCKMSVVGMPQVIPARGVDGTYAGIPSGGEKGDYVAETLGMGHYRHPFPLVPGTRRMRNKDRLIFMDANPNVRYVERELTAVRNWLKYYFPEYFGAWRDPNEVVNPMITKALQLGAASVEADYQGMDMHFTKKLVIELILPIYEVLIPGSFLPWASFIEELFSAPLFLGDSLIIGEHALFSGIGPTNDFETIYSILLYLAGKLEVLAPQDKQSGVLALGDDICVFTSSDVAKDLLQFMIELSNEANMVIHPLGSKTVIGNGDVRFLRTVYALGMSVDSHGVIQGAYPSVLAINNIIQPEKPHPTVPLEAAAILSRLDNLRWNPEFYPVVEFISKRVGTPLRAPALELPRDWWARVYGTQWSPKSSPSFQVLHGLPLSKDTKEPLYDLRDKYFPGFAIGLEYGRRIKSF